MLAVRASLARSYLVGFCGYRDGGDLRRPIGVTMGPTGTDETPMSDPHAPIHFFRVFSWPTRRVVGVAFAISIAFNFLGLWQVGRLSLDQSRQSRRVGIVNAKQAQTAKAVALTQAATLRAQAKTIRTIEMIGNEAIVTGCEHQNQLRDSLVSFVDGLAVRSEASAKAMIASPQVSTIVKVTALKNLAAAAAADQVMHRTVRRQMCTAPLHLTPTTPTSRPAP